MRGLVVPLVLALQGCGAQSVPADGGGGSGPPCFDGTLTDRQRWCGLVAHVECGTCEPGEWCDQPNGICRDVIGPCERCAGGCALNGQCTEEPCAGPCDETVSVPGGEFLDGSGPGVDAQWLDAFRIGRFEVSVARYRACVDSSVCGEPPWDEVGLSVPGALSDPAFDDFPVSGIYAYDAAAFCEWEGGRLPTRLEWAKAARGGCEARGTAECEEGVDGVRNPWGDDAPDCGRANFATDRDAGEYCAGRPDPVGSRPGGASVYGAEDMLGNVPEWMAGEGCEGRYCRQGTDWTTREASVLIANWMLGIKKEEHDTAGFRCVHPP